MRSFAGRDILSLKEFERNEFFHVFDVAAKMEVIARGRRNVDMRKEKTLVTAFYQPSTRTHHRARRVLARDIRCANARRDHRVPAPRRLFPERRHPREAAIFDHAFVAAPGNVHEHIEVTALVLNLLKHRRDRVIVGVIAGDPRDGGVEIGASDRTTSGIHLRARVSQAECDAASDAAACARDERDTSIQIGHTTVETLLSRAYAVKAPRRVSPTRID